MKKIIALVAFFILITLGAYLGFGILAKKNCQLAIADMQANFPGHIDSTYKQGLFSSDLTLKLAIPIPDANPDTPESITTLVRQTIYHGPFIFSGQKQIISRFTPVQLYAQGSLEIEPFMGNEPPFVAQLRELAKTDITVHAPLMGRTKVTFRGTPLQNTLLVGSDSFALNWQGFSGTLFVKGNNLLTYDLDFLAPRLAIQGTGPAGIIIEGLTAQVTMEEGSNNLSLGSVTTSLKKLEAILGSGPAEKLTLAGLNLRITSSEQDALLRVVEEITMDNLSFSDKKYGPGNLKITLANLDAQTVGQLTEAYKALQNNPGNNESVAALGLLSSHAAALLAKSPEIRLNNFSLASPDGGCLASAHLAFNGEGEVILNPLFLLGRLSAEATFSADERFLAVQTKNFLKDSLCAERADPACDQDAAQASSTQLQGLVDQNILLLDGGKYSLTASFKDGQAMLNGQPVPLSF